MNITVMDRDPGRCNNLRVSRYYPGKYLRCLDYEGTPHTCIFPGELGPSVSTYAMHVQGETQPKPWVKPKATP